MAQSSKYARIDEDVLVEFIYHDQSDTSSAEIENDDNGSQLKFLDIDNSASPQRYLVHELGANVVNFTVTISGSSIFVNGFAFRELQISNNKTYKFNLNDASINNAIGFKVATSTNPNAGILSGAGTPPDPYIYTYIPSANGTFSYGYTDFGGADFGNGVITVADKANSLYAEPEQETGNSIESATGQKGRYLAVPSTQANKFALVGNNLDYLDSNVWTGTSASVFNTVIPDTDVNEVYYDTVRLHLRSGYSFNGRGYDGFLLQIKSNRVDGKENVFSSIVYLNSSSFEIQNPSPFTMGDSMFSKYVEVKIPALVHMFTASLNDDFQDHFYGLSGSGTEVDSTSNYKISFSLISSTSSELIPSGSTSYPQDFITIDDTTDLVISQVDEYSSISVNVEEPTDSDYFEIHGEVDGSLSSFGGYVNDRIQTTSDDISVFYEIEVSEQVSTNFINTYKTTFVKSQGFDEPIMFRPVIINAGICSKFLLRVTMRIYNETDNTQIVKVGTLVYDRPKKYGKQLEKINVDGITNPIIYNKLPNTAVNRELNGFINSIRPDIGETKYVKVALDKYNVVAAQNELIGNSADGVSLGDANFKTEGQCELRISSASNTLVRFTLANLIDGDYRAIDLVGAENIKLVIYRGDTEVDWNLHDPTFPGIDLSNGEVMFKIGKGVASNFTGIGSIGTFYIVLEYGDGNTSRLYNGKIKVI
jgi:hypothetical protein